MDSVGQRLGVASQDAPVRRIVTVSVKTLWKGVLPREVGKDYVLFVTRFTPERPLSPAAPGDFTSGFVAAECASRPAATFDLKALGLSRPPLP